MHEGLSTPTGRVELPGRDGRYPETRRQGCPRWPERLWLLSSAGERVPGRCRATNLCDYCARLAAVENTEMLALDAVEGDAPQIWAVLGTRTVTTDMAAFYNARAKVMRALRRRWPDAEYASLLEFTTGYGKRSGGKRRPHWNLLLKGIPLDDLDEAGEVIRSIWCAHVDALPDYQYVGPVREAGGLMRYIALHFQKESQAPPEGFRGQRFNCSRGYFTGRTRAEAREDAKLSLRDKRWLHKATSPVLEGGMGLEGDEAEDFVDSMYALEDGVEWRLYAERSPRVPADDRTIAHVPESVLAAAFDWVEDDHPGRSAAEANRDAAATSLRSRRGFSDRPQLSATGKAILDRREAVRRGEAAPLKRYAYLPVVLWPGTGGRGPGDCSRAVGTAPTVRKAIRVRTWAPSLDGCWINLPLTDLLPEV